MAEKRIGEDKLEFDDASDIVQSRGSMLKRQQSFKKRVTSKNLPIISEVIKRVDVATEEEKDDKLSRWERDIRKALSTRGIDRKKEDLVKLENLLIQSTAFQGLKREYEQTVVEQFLKMLTLSEFKAGEDIIKYEEENPYYYIIISGIVQILHPVTIYKAFTSEILLSRFKSENAKKIISEHRLTKANMSYIPKEAFVTEPLLHNDVVYRIRFVIMEEMALLKSLDAFGELSLSPKKPISLWFKAVTNVVLARVERQQYVKLIRYSLRKKGEKFFDLLMTIPFFNRFSQWSLEKIASSVDVKNFSKKQFVYKEGDEVDYVYIVKEGEFEIYKTVRFCEDEGNEETIERLPMKNLRIRNLTTNQIFGDIELGLNKARRMNSVQCASAQGSVFILSKNILQSILESDDLEKAFKAEMRESYENTESITNTLIKYQEVKLPKVLRKKNTARKVIPLTYEEARDIKKRIHCQMEQNLLQEIRKSIPNYRVDNSYKYYDSRIMHGEVEEIGFLGLFYKNKKSMANNNATPKVQRRSQSVESSMRNPLPSESVVNTEELEKTARNTVVPPKYPQRVITEKILETRRKLFRTLNRRNWHHSFVPSLTIRSHSPSKVFSPPFSYPTSPRRDPESCAPVAHALNDIASEFAEQYKAFNEGNPYLQEQDMPVVLNTILQSNKYVQNMIKSAVFIQRKSSHIVKKTKHNLFRFKK